MINQQGAHSGENGPNGQMDATGAQREVRSDWFRMETESCRRVEDERTGSLWYSIRYQGVSYTVHVWYGRPVTGHPTEYYLIIEDPRNGRPGPYEVPPFEDENKTGFDSQAEALEYAEELIRRWHREQKESGRL